MHNKNYIVAISFIFSFILFQSNLNADDSNPHNLNATALNTCRIMKEHCNNWQGNGKECRNLNNSKCPDAYKPGPKPN